MKNITDCSDERTFYYTGTLQNLTVPDDPLITGMVVEMWGAGGGGGAVPVAGASAKDLQVVVAVFRVVLSVYRIVHLWKYLLEVEEAEECYLPE